MSFSLTNIQGTMAKTSLVQQNADGAQRGAETAAQQTAADMKSEAEEKLETVNEAEDPEGRTIKDEEKEQEGHTDKKEDDEEENEEESPKKSGPKPPDFGPAPPSLLDLKA